MSELKLEKNDKGEFCFRRNQFSGRAILEMEESACSVDFGKLQIIVSDLEWDIRNLSDESVASEFREVSSAIAIQNEIDETAVKSFWII